MHSFVLNYQIPGIRILGTLFPLGMLYDRPQFSFRFDDSGLQKITMYMIYCSLRFGCGI